MRTLVCPAAAFVMDVDDDVLEDRGCIGLSDAPILVSGVRYPRFSGSVRPVSRADGAG
jgi:hypothetical protein